MLLKASVSSYERMVQPSSKDIVAVSAMIIYVYIVELYLYIFRLKLLHRTRPRAGK